jgi:hypothetical protein
MFKARTEIKNPQRVAGGFCFCVNSTVNLTNKSAMAFIVHSSFNPLCGVGVAWMQHQARFKFAV